MQAHVSIIKTSTTGLKGQNLVKKIIDHIRIKAKHFLENIPHRKLIAKDPENADIYLVAFPKSGVTWLSFLLGNIELKILGRDEHITFFNYHKYVPDIHQLGISKINRELTRTFIKSHSFFNPNYFLAIYLIRNPFDVMVSYYNYMRNYGYKSNFKNFLKNPNYGIKLWCQHIDGWFPEENLLTKIHLLRYEDLKETPQETILDIYKNLGLKLDLKILDKAIASSNIKEMKASEEFYTKHDPRYKVPFVGKDGKIAKESLLNDENREYIYTHSKKILKRFYPELIK